jgi:DUF1680 family protein
LKRAWSLRQKPDPQLEKTADEVIELLAQAQCEDGYLNTWYTVKSRVSAGPTWPNATNFTVPGICSKRRSRSLTPPARAACSKSPAVLPITSTRCSARVPVSFAGYPGHPEIELALMRLYEITREPRYQALARFFVEERGQQPHYYDIEFENAAALATGSAGAMPGRG